MTRLLRLATWSLISLLIGSATARSETGAVSLNAETGIKAPLGLVGLAATYRLWQRLDLGIGLGWDRPLRREFNIHAAAFARLYVLTLGPFSLSAMGGISRQDFEQRERLERPHYTPRRYSWLTEGALRWNGSVGLEWQRGAFRVRADAGIAWITSGNQSCTERDEVSTVEKGYCAYDDYHPPPPNPRFPWGSLSLGWTTGTKSSTGKTPTVSEPYPADPLGNTTGASPTALTLPKGKFSLRNYELLFPGIVYGLTDRIEVGFAFLFPIADVSLIAATVKVRLLDEGPFHAALFAGGLTGSAIGGDALTALIGGPVISYCVDQGCATVLSAHALALRSFSKLSSGSSGKTDVTLLAGFNARIRLASWFAAVADTHIAIDPTGTAIIVAGRFIAGRVGFDLGVWLGKRPTLVVPVLQVAWTF